MRIVDLTRPIRETMPVFPGDPPPQFSVSATVPRDGYRETLLRLTSHTGTHMDAPAHVFPNGRPLDAFPAERFVGRAAVLHCGRCPGTVTLDDPAPIREAADRSEFLLLHTGWSFRWGTPAYFRGYPIMDDGLVQYVIDSGKKGVGVDAMSVDPIDSFELPIHRRLLAAGVSIVENLQNLAQLPPEPFGFCALPLLYENADGAPVRAVAILE